MNVTQTGPVTLLGGDAFHVMVHWLPECEPPSRPCLGKAKCLHCQSGDEPHDRIYFSAMARPPLSLVGAVVIGMPASQELDAILAGPTRGKTCDFALDAPLIEMFPGTEGDRQ